MSSQITQDRLIVLYGCGNDGKSTLLQHFRGEECVTIQHLFSIQNMDIGGTVITTTAEEQHLSSKKVSVWVLVFDVTNRRSTFFIQETKKKLAGKKVILVGTFAKDAKQADYPGIILVDNSTGLGVEAFKRAILNA